MAVTLHTSPALVTLNGSTLAGSARGSEFGIRTRRPSCVNTWTHQSTATAINFGMKVYAERPEEVP